MTQHVSVDPGVEAYTSKRCAGQVDCQVSSTRQGPSTDCSWAAIQVGFPTYAGL